MAIDVQFAFFFFQIDKRLIAAVSSRRNGVIVAPVIYHVVLAHMMWHELFTRYCRDSFIRHEICFFPLELIGRDTTYAVVFRTVGCTFQPAQDILVQQVDVDKLTTAKEVVLHIFDHVLYLTLTLGIGLMAEYGLEAMFPNQGTEAAGKHQIAKVFLN